MFRVSSLATNIYISFPSSSSNLSNELLPTNSIISSFLTTCSTNYFNAATYYAMHSFFFLFRTLSILKLVISNFLLFSFYLTYFFFPFSYDVGFLPYHISDGELCYLANPTTSSTNYFDTTSYFATLFFS